MNCRSYLAVSASLFGIVAVAHLMRLLFQWPFVVGGWSVPAWISVLGMLVPGALAWWGVRLARDVRAADH